ncbi:hypothetical protein AMAG_11495 [Allomyces macrogynus ATCC 38327]|uniref:Uncharacterized protein n=1 Tax=Allomyces macrogynus (strain ATCC 38327) TaxID=578462 RepID=A0A0L0SV10_ALLM3|nr:hypothetical protein AMAG_11495 [Allomyces macrogynus ATCC 38327]|eukprot:KNE66352.1 hypothetical protein AMAG_11495 [Allomyces macrogynus ATCC 38327]
MTPPPATHRTAAHAAPSRPQPTAMPNPRLDDVKTPYHDEKRPHPAAHPGASGSGIRGAVPGTPAALYQRPGLPFITCIPLRQGVQALLVIRLIALPIAAGLLLTVGKDLSARWHTAAVLALCSLPILLFGLWAATAARARAFRIFSVLYLLDVAALVSIMVLGAPLSESWPWLGLAFGDYASLAFLAYARVLTQAEFATAGAPMPWFMV